MEFKKSKLLKLIIFEYLKKKERDRINENAKNQITNSTNSSDSTNSTNSSDYSNFPNSSKV